MKRLTKVLELIKDAEEKFEIADYKAAEIILIKAIDLDHHDPEPYYLLGEALCKQERFEESVQSLKIANKLFPQHPRILHLLGWATFLNNDKQKGRELLLQALELQPDDIKILCDLTAVEINENNMDVAKKYVDKAHTLEPENPQVQELREAVAFFAKISDELLTKIN